MITPLTTSSPEGAPRGGVVVIQEAFGITEHIVDVCRRFAAAGWVAVAPHLFHRSGDPVIDYADMSAAMPLMRELAASEIDADVDAAFSAVAEAGLAPEQSAIVGFCMGGTVSFHTAVRRPLGAAATFYGSGVREGRFGYPPMLEVADALQTPWHGFFGDLDQSIPSDQVEDLRAAVYSAPVATALIRYADAQHGFHCDDRPGVYNAEAAADAWDTTLAWFEQHVARSQFS